MKAINAAYTEFEISFFVEELASTVKAQNQLFDFIYRHLAVAEIDLAFPEDRPAQAAADGELRTGRTGVERLLELVTIFATFTPEERAAIAAKLTQHSYDEGETLLETGAVSQSLCIIGNGVVSITVDGPEGDIEVLRLGPGDVFGEFGLLAGTPSPGRVCALMPATVYELAKSDLSPILKARPQVAQKLCR